MIGKTFHLLLNIGANLGREIVSSIVNCYFHIGSNP
jgi:hypothetical protein